MTHLRREGNLYKPWRGQHSFIYSSSPERFLLIMARHSASLIEHISNGYAKVIRFIYSLIPRRIFLYILRKSWESPIGFQRWNIKNSTLPLLEWKPHHVKIALPGVDANNPELLSSWIGENIRDEGLVDGWKEIDRVVLYIHGAFLLSIILFTCLFISYFLLIRWSFLRGLSRDVPRDQSHVD